LSDKLEDGPARFDEWLCEPLSEFRSTRKCVSFRWEWPDIDALTRHEVPLSADFYELTLTSSVFSLA